MSYYAVGKGRTVGVFTNWLECEAQVKGFPKAKFKKFKNRQEAERYVSQHKEEFKDVISGSHIENGIRPGRKKSGEQRTQETRPAQKMRGEGKALELIENRQVSRKRGPKTSQEQESNPSKRKKVETNADLDPNQSAFLEDLDGDLELLQAVENIEKAPAKQMPDAKRRATGVPFKVVKMGPNKFLVDKDNYVQVYIAGQCDNIGEWCGSAGYGVYFGKNHALNHFGPCSGRMTNNIGDIEAGIHTLKVSKRIGLTQIVIHTGSDFLMKVIGGWLRSWKLRGWRKQDGKKVSNCKQLQELDALLSEDGLIVKWVNSNEEKEFAKEALAEVKLLAEFGMDEYLENHPSKDIDFLDMSGGNDLFDFF